jgi:Cd2+/Zn2+-exporting ATPase
MSTSRIDFRVANLDCEHDASAIQRGLKNVPGLVELKVLPAAGKVAVTYDPAQTEPEALKEKLRSLGFPAQAGAEMAGPPPPWRNPKVLTSVASGALLLIGWLMARAGAPEAVARAAYLIAILSGGYFFGREAIEELLFERKVGIELLMSLAAVVATVMGQAAEGAMLVFLYSISEAAEGYTEEKTRAAIRGLMNLAPKVALVRRDGRELEIPIEELQVGDLFIVKSGQSVATDGVVRDGTSSVNQAPVTGESIPVGKHSGDTVFAGSLNGEGVLEVRATKTFADNTISRIIQMVEGAQERKGRSQRFIERFGSRYSPIVLLVGILIAVGAPLLLGAPWATWLTRATVFIVAAAPCALVISVPITLVATLGTGASRGVLVKGGVYIEELAKIKVVAMDKTGTLTRGEPEVTDVLVWHNGGGADPATAHEVLALAAGIERLNQHPLARAIVRRARAGGVTPVEGADFRALTGEGASARINQETAYAGGRKLFEGRLGVSLGSAEADVSRLEGEGKTVVLLGTEKTLWGLLAIRDTIRPNARQAIEALYAFGVSKVVMLTGDNERTAQAIGSELGLEDVYAELRPEDKATKVRELAERYGHVAMVGDGVNDAPALAEATVGVAMGAAGTDVALETADVALMADNLEKLVYALHLAHRNRSVVMQNLVLSTVVIGALVIGAVAGVFSLPVAVLGHEISEFVVIGSGLRMLRA